MHRIIADKNGGRRVECSPEECAAIEAEWASNAAKQLAEEAAAAEEKRLQEEAMAALTASLPKDQGDALKKLLAR